LFVSAAAHTWLRRSTSHSCNTANGSSKISNSSSNPVTTQRLNTIWQMATATYQDCPKRTRNGLQNRLAVLPDEHVQDTMKDSASARKR
jgi:uncharacterized protein (DUF1499 family)